MDVTSELDALRAEMAGCALVAYADLTSKLVLSKSASSNPEQEELMSLSSAAQLALDGAFAEGAAPVWGEAGPSELAMLLTGSEARLFFRSPANANEALLCVCAPDVDLEAAVAQARSALRRIADLA